MYFIFSEWTRTFTDTLFGLINFSALDFGCMEEPKLAPCLQGTNDVTVVLGNRPCTRWQLFQLMGKLMTKPSEVLLVRNFGGLVMNNFLSLLIAKCSVHSWAETCCL